MWLGLSPSAPAESRRHVQAQWMHPAFCYTQMHLAGSRLSAPNESAANGRMSRKPLFETESAEEDLGAAAPPRNMQAERRIALFIDFENIAIGVIDAKYKKFEVSLLLERLLEKGKIVVKRAYCDWDKFPDAKRELHEAAIELVPLGHSAEEPPQAPSMPRLNLATQAYSFREVDYPLIRQVHEA